MSNTANTGWWSVGLTLSESEAGPLSGVITGFNAEVIRYVSIGNVSPVEPDGIDSLVIELRGEDRSSAISLAESLLRELRGQANLPEVDTPVAWAVPLSEEDASSHRFISIAKDLAEDEAYSGMAAIAAQIHLEVQVRTLFGLVADASDLTRVKKLAKLGGLTGLGSERSKTAVLLILGIDVTDTPEWPEFKAHLDRRNAIVHGGLEIGRVDAVRSVEVAHLMSLRLAEAYEALAVEGSTG